MNKHLSLFRIRFSNGIQYRAAAAAGVATQFAWGFFEILLYSAFFRANPEAFPMGFDQLSVYIWLRQAFLAMYAPWIWDTEILGSISSGGIAYELTRPMDLYNMWFIKTAAGRMSRAVLRCLPILLVAVFLPAPYGLSAPHSPLAFALFLPSMVLSFLVTISIEMLIYISSFYTISSNGIRGVAMTLIDFLAGGIIPLPFFPDSLRKIIELTPFAAMQNVPFRVYSGNMSGNELYLAIALQLAWLVFLLACGKQLMKKALKRVVIQGG